MSSRKMMKLSSRDLWQCLLVVIVLISLLTMIRGRLACGVSGGTYLRGFLWFECVHLPAGDARIGTNPGTVRRTRIP